MYMAATWTEQKKFKGVVDVKMGTVPGYRFSVITGQVTIRGDIMKGIANDLEECTITPDMKKEERNGCACRYMYYPDMETQEYVRSLSRGP